MLSASKVNKYLIAYSGGVDSHVLLHLMSCLQAENPSWHIRAIHINHGINVNARQWERHCQKVCKKLAIPLTIKRIDLGHPQGESLEAAARHARYAEFKKSLQRGEALLTAHNQDDQAETVLLQLLRGAGPKGLSAMPADKTFASGLHLRPLLSFTRQAIETYARQHQLQWIEDDSNLNVKFDRNFIRREIMPIIQQRWPKANVTLSRAAQHCADADKLLDEMAHADWQSVICPIKKGILLNICRVLYPHHVTHFIDLRRLTALSKTRQNHVIRHWMQSYHLTLPSTQQLQEVFANVISSKHDATPLMFYENFEIRRYREQLWLVPQLPVHDVTLIIAWDIKKALILPNGLGKLTWQTSAEQSPLATQKITVRFRQGGEKIKPIGRQETHSLKKLLQETGMPPWLRDRLPLIYADEQLVAVADWLLAAELASSADAVCLGVFWRAR
jgi:tRNA(Ile)-lysidine synthase